MSKKPTLTIRYPEASEKALKLTEAMVKRSPGKRTVETESEDPIFPDDGDLFSSFIRCKTSTGVDLTLTLNPVQKNEIWKKHLFMVCLLRVKTSRIG